MNAILNRIFGHDVAREIMRHVGQKEMHLSYVIHRELIPKAAWIKKRIDYSHDVKFFNKKTEKYAYWWFLAEDYVVKLGSTSNNYDVSIAKRRANLQMIGRKHN